MAGTYGPALLRACVHVCVCVHTLICMCPPRALLSPVLLFPVVISERKVIRRLIEGAGKGEEGEAGPGVGGGRHEPGGLLRCRACAAPVYMCTERDMRRI